PRRSPRKTVEDSKPEGPSISKQKFSPSKSEKSKHHKCFEDTSSVDSPKRKKLSDRKDKHSAVKSPKKFEGGKEKFANVHQMAAADESKSRSNVPEKKLKESRKKHKEIEKDSGNVHTVAVNHFPHFQAIFLK
ncbi:hypothetical protein AB6A40_011566, partial [Gnathostoma spinigerum]